MLFYSPVSPVFTHGWMKLCVCTDLLLSGFSLAHWLHDFTFLARQLFPWTDWSDGNSHSRSHEPSRDWTTSRRSSLVPPTPPALFRGWGRTRSTDSDISIETRTILEMEAASLYSTLVICHIPCVQTNLFLSGIHTRDHVMVFLHLWLGRDCPKRPKLPTNAYLNKWGSHYECIHLYSLSLRADINMLLSFIVYTHRLCTLEINPCE